MTKQHTQEKMDKRAAALRDNLKRRKQRTKDIKAQASDVKTAPKDKE